MNLWAACLSLDLIVRAQPGLLGSWPLGSGFFHPGWVVYLCCAGVALPPVFPAMRSLADK
jgi:hypothetical protein